MIPPLQENGPRDRSIEFSQLLLVCFGPGYADRCCPVITVRDWTSDGIDYMIFVVGIHGCLHLRFPLTFCRLAFAILAYSIDDVIRTV